MQLLIIIIYLRMMYSTCLVATFRDNGLHSIYCLLQSVAVQVAVQVEQFSICRAVGGGSCLVVVVGGGRG